MDQNFLTYHVWYRSNFESSYKNHPLSRATIFSDVTLVSNHHGCKGETISLIPYYMIDIIYKTVKPSHFQKITNHAKINKLMFQYSKSSSYSLIEFL